MTRLVKKTLLVFITFIALALQACGPEAKSKNELRATISTEPPTLDPNLATDTISFFLLNQLYDGLTQFDENLNVLPAAALSWDISSDGLTYRFQLNPNGCWSDGAPVTAQNFIDSWLRLLDPKTAAPYAYFLYPIRGAKSFNEGKTTNPKTVGLTADGNFTLVVELETPTVFFPQITTFMVTFPIRLPKDPQTFIGNGAYRLKSWKHDDHLVLQKNELYSGLPKPQLEKITLSIVPEAITALALYERGDIDYVAIPPLAIDALRTRPDHIMVRKLRGYYYGFNLTLPPYNDVRLRKALAMSLDKREIPQLLHGGEIAVNSWVPPGLFGYAPNIGLTFNPADAKALLLEAFGKSGPGPLDLTFNYDATNKRLAEWAQGQWKKNLGLEVTLVNEEWKSFLNHLHRQPPGLYRMGWGADYPDPDNFLNLFTSYSGNNHTKGKNAAYDKLITEGARTSDPKLRKAIYDQAQRFLLEDDVAIIPLFVSTSHYLVSPRVAPLKINALDILYFKTVGMKK